MPKSDPDKPKPSPHKLALRKCRSDPKVMLTLPVNRLGKRMKSPIFQTVHNRIGYGAPVYCASVIECCLTKLIKLSGDEAKLLNRQRIIPRNILFAIRKDYELDCLLKGVIIPQGGVIPHIHTKLLPTKPKHPRNIVINTQIQNENKNENQNENKNENENQNEEQNQNVNQEY